MGNEALDQVVQDAVDASAFEDDPVETTETTEEVETASTETDTPAVEEPATDAAPAAEAVADTEADAQVAAPGKEKPAAAAVEDPLAKFGIPPKSITGRDNPIPYSRVRKIVDKSVKDTTAAVTKALEEKYTPQLTAATTKIQDYEERLTRVGQFEHIMEKQPREFLSMLSQLPAYQPFFEAVSKAVQGQHATPAGQTAKPAAPTTGDDPMPQPNRKLADGSTFYDMEGLQQLMDWQSRQVEKRVTAQIESRVSERYSPIENEWRQRERIAQITPIIEKQLAEARTWHGFSANEVEIEAALRKDPTLSLEGAYRQVVIPKLTLSQDQQRSRILEEIRKKPATTAAPAARTAPKRASQTPPKNADDIIYAALDEAGINITREKD